MIEQERIAPITDDLRTEDKKMNVIKGLETMQVTDLKNDDPADDIQPGMWVHKTSTGCTLGVGALNYLVWVGNNQYDAIATKGVTVILSGNALIYETTQYAAGSYTIGDLLTPNADGKLEEAGASDPVVGKVVGIDASKGVMTVELMPGHPIPA